jgi:hypothetical protein
MKKPSPEFNKECPGCLQQKPLLMPVPVAPGWPIIMWELLCIECRLNVRSDEWGTLGWELKHSKNKKTRDSYSKWIAATLFK